jgi:SAM-dependent methyltransferase
MSSGAPPAQPKYPWKDIPGSSHDVLLRRILARPAGLSVLDLGFGAGALARRVRAHCRYLAGIELDAEAAREGSPFFDDAVTGDLLEGVSGPWREPFDVIVAGDILEHLPEPERLLARLLPLLGRGGVFLLSLPNVANVTVRAALLAGRFPYADRGILDRTHVRFYTRSSARGLLAGSGLRIAWETATAMPVELAFPALGTPPLAGPVRAGARLLAAAWPTLFGYQFVFEAAPA